jgi:hypothetical protein
MAEESKESRKITTGKDYFEEVKDQAQVFTGPVFMRQAEKVPLIDPEPLQKAYLSRLFETCGQVFLVGIDRKTAGQQTEACLKLSGIYTALLTLSAEYDIRKGRAPLGKEKEVERRSSAVEQLKR